MLASIRPVQSLLIAIFVMMAGSGFLSTLIGLRLERAGSGTMVIGLVATAYFVGLVVGALRRSEEHTSELQSLMRISYAVFCLKNKNLNIIHLSSKDKTDVFTTYRATTTTYTTIHH